MKYRQNQPKSLSASASNRSDNGGHIFFIKNYDKICHFAFFTTSDEYDKFDQ